MHSEEQYVFLIWWTVGRAVFPHVAQTHSGLSSIRLA